MQKNHIDELFSLIMRVMKFHSFIVTLPLALYSRLMNANHNISPLKYNCHDSDNTVIAVDYNKNGLITNNCVLSLQALCNI